MSPRAIGVATRLTRDYALAEDITAEAFARAYARWSTVSTHPNPDAWLLRVLGNLVIDEVRKNGRTEAIMVTLTADLSNSSSIRADSDAPGNSAVSKILVADAINGLSKKQRDVVILRHLADLSIDEVANSMGVSSGSIKTHLHRATTKMRIDLDDDLPPSLGTSGATSASDNVAPQPVIDLRDSSTASK